MYCTTCGTQVTSGAIFCAQCGTRLSQLVGQSSSSTSNASHDVSAPPSSLPTPPMGAYPPGYGPPPGAQVHSASSRPDPILNSPLAPWWKRFVALIIDSSLLGVGYFVVLAVIGALVRSTPRGSATYSTTTTHASAGSIIVGILVLSIFAAIPNSLYFGIMNGSKRGQTVGKMALGIAVRDARTGQPIGFWRGVSRCLITVVFELALYIPFLVDSFAPLWDKRHQAWHDKVVRSVVIDLNQ